MKNIAMRTYLVDAPEPQEGQIASTGGIRSQKSGEMAVQYRNPRLYIEGNLYQDVQAHYSVRDRMQECLTDSLVDAISIGIQELIIPTTIALIQRGITWMFSNHSSKENEVDKKCIDNENRICAAENEMETASPKIINFPAERVV